MVHHLQPMNRSFDFCSDVASAFDTLGITQFQQILLIYPNYKRRGCIVGGICCDPIGSVPPGLNSMSLKCLHTHPPTPTPDHPGLWKKPYSKGYLELKGELDHLYCSYFPALFFILLYSSFFIYFMIFCIWFFKKYIAAFVPIVWTLNGEMGYKCFKINKNETKKGKYPILKCRSLTHCNLKHAHRGIGFSCLFIP